MLTFSLLYLIVAESVISMPTSLCMSLPLRGSLRPLEA